MTTDQTILPYAGRQQDESGLTPATLLAIYAIGAAISYSAYLIPILPLIGKLPFSTYGQVMAQNLIAAVLLAVGGGLVLSRVDWGRWFAVGVCAASLLAGEVFTLGWQFAGWSLQGARPRAPFYELPLARQVAMLASDVQVLAAGCLLLWLLWNLARDARASLSCGQIRWRAIARSTHCYILVAGGALVLRILAESVSRMLADNTSAWVAASLTVVAGLMVIAGLCGLARKPWAPVICAIALAVWWLYPLAEIILTTGEISTLWAFNKMVLILPLLNPIAVLLVLLVLHPCVRQASSGDGEPVAV